MVKKIVLLADGTGNAFLTQESNIWRIYRALDLSDKDQVACYIEGVGTSKFWPLAVFDGATGFGVPENIRKLYRFLCWNYEPDAEIYMFGFSRGAFTIRALIGLIASEGLIARDQADGPISQTEMEEFTSNAYWVYRFKSFEAMKFSRTPPLVYVARGIRALTRARRKAHYDKIKKIEAPTIGFVGLFDTVEAFGVPIDEMRTAIDRMIWPISFRNHVMSENVRVTRHALSLDDERTTFHPIRVALKPQGQACASQSLKEVWFAGAHSDVGGGYPDGALSFVSLDWMLKELDRAKAGLKFKEGAVETLRRDASSFGVLHDPRDGLGVLYRYDPRSADGAKDCGPTVIHHSIVERMVLGSDNYAPIAVSSAEALVALPSGDERPVFVDPRETRTGENEPADKTIIEVIDRLEEPGQQYIDQAQNWIWWRRRLYYALLTVFALLILSPWTADFISSKIGGFLGMILPPPPGRVGDLADALREIVGEFVSFLKEILPSVATMYLEKFVHDPIYMITLAYLARKLLKVNEKWRNETLYNARRAWSFEGRHVPLQKPALGASSMDSLRSRLSAARAALPFGQTVMTGIARFFRAFPKVNRGWDALRGTMASLFWSFVVLVILAIPLTLAARLTFNLRGPKYSCRESTTPEKLSWVSSASPKFSKDGFTTNTPCWPSGAAVEKETAYRLTIEITEPWLDGTILTDAGGYWPEFPWGHFFDKPRLRWPSAGAFQPIARIGLKGGVEWPLVSKDGAGPLQSGVEKCTRMPIPYERTEAYCAAHGFPPTDNYKSCWEAPALLGANGFVASLFGSDPLAAAERAMVAKAWNDPAGVWRYDEKPNKCVSAHPRKTFVSEFVAMHTGELFLFVNDMIPPFGLGGARAHYRNNLGAAKITLEPVPLAGPEVK